MSSAIVVRAVTKRYRIPHPHRPHTLHEALVRAFRGVRSSETFVALEAVDLDVEAGSTLGLMGPNGAGKSTLLRLIAGVGRPDEGSIEVRGRLTALLDLGAGFHSDLTGRENVFLSGVIQGLTRAEVRDRFDAIVGFAELEPFIDKPVRTYSSGMRLRLAFAISTQIEPDVLMVDEVLAVGDLAFRQKCISRIGDLKAKGCTLVLCSHDMGLIGDLCDDVAWLEDGGIRWRGPASEVVAAYVREAGAAT